MANLWRRSANPTDAGRERRRTNATGSDSPDDVTEIIPAVTDDLGAADASRQREPRRSHDRPPGASRYVPPAAGVGADGAYAEQPDRQRATEPGEPSDPGTQPPSGPPSSTPARSDTASSVAAPATPTAPDAAATPTAPDAAATPTAPDAAATPTAPDAPSTRTAPDAAATSPRPPDTRRSLDDQLAKVLSSIGSIDPIELAILDAQGLTLAEDVRSPRALPGFDNSAVDGYAVRAVDIRSADEGTPVVLPVVGDVIAGARSISGMGPGLAMRIMTGAPLPAGADAVVRVEDTDAGVARVSIRAAAPSGTAVRRAGEDMPAGQLALGEGAALGPQQIGLLAAIGRDRVLVHPRPRVVVISTGNELVEVGHAPGFGQVSDANSYLLAAAARDAGAQAYRVGIVADDHAQLMDVLESQLLRADIIVTSGGVSMGAYDVVKEALGELGTVEFIQVAMQPGKPQGFGFIGAGRTPIFCLPGNPVSSLVSFEMFVRPAIRKLLGKRRVERATVPAVALDRIKGTAGTRLFRRGLLHREQDGTYSVSTVGGPGSHLIGALAASNCLIVVAEDLVEVVPGSRVPVIPLLLSQR